MPINGLYTLSHLLLDGASDTVIDQVQSHSLDTGIQYLLESSDGLAVNTAATIGSLTPKFSFTSSKIKGLIDTFGIVGYHIGNETEGNNVDLKAWFQLMQRGGARAATGHKLLTISRGLVVPVNLTAGQNAIASMGYDVQAFDPDGVNSPISMSTAVLAGTLSLDQLYKAGPATANGTLINGVRDIRYDFGFQLSFPVADGLPYPTYATVMMSQPVITLTVFDLGICEAISEAGEAVTGSTKFYLRKLTRGGGVVANSTAQHIEFTINDGMISWENPNASQGQELTVTVKFTPTATGVGGAAVSVSTSAAIT